ncbi:MAG: heparinase II/III family protein [Gammaproteobacteria bacterium]|nr:heparinase II/III family protein [Gammaproteobacteria bacterium]
MAALNPAGCGRGPIPRWSLLAVAASAVFPAGESLAQEHPRLLLVAAEIRELKDQWPRSTLFSAAVERTRSRIDALVASPPDVPAPKDPGGGYTHERHKANGIVIAEAGALYQWTGESAYADLVRQLLLAYAGMYPELGLHPERKEQSPGRLFWQSLNESVFLTYAIQGYDAIHATLDTQDRERIEARLFGPMADFLSVESPQVFDRIHNHGTWATAAVGMTGYVLDDDDLVEMALMGTARDGKAGFLAQLRQLFSPDGYYLEGPYYQRYALMPFVLFAKAIEHNEPERQIFEYRSGIVAKAIRTTVQLSYAGLFFPINDAIRDKGLDTVELDYAIAIAYGVTGDPAFLSLVDDASNIVLTTDGLRLALAREAGRATPFPFASRHFRDGPAGDQGALTILRAGGAPGAALVFKATSHGMGHGHFDRLHWMFYDNGAEIVADYGAARFLNVPQKAGGRYLPENKTWAKQTVAHNTLVVDAASQFGGDYKQADQSWPTGHYYHVGDGVQIVSADERAAYPGTLLRRTMLLLEWPELDHPLVIDVLKARSKDARRFDLPLYFSGALIETQPAIDMGMSLQPLGDANGYQHLWGLGEAQSVGGDRLAFTWLTNGRFYTYNVIANADIGVAYTRVGATDPDFNLRSEPGFIFGADSVRNLDIVAVLEPHGEYNGAREYTIRSESQVVRLQRLDDDGKDLVIVETKAGATLAVVLSYDPNPNTAHTIRTAVGEYRWRGYHRVFGHGYEPDEERQR